MSRRVHTRRLIVAIAASLVISTLCLVAFARFAAKHADNVKLGDRVFQVGKSASLAKKVDRDGPLLFNDLVSGDGLRRPLVLTHLSGTDWAALNALPSGSEERCAVRPDVAARTLVDPCTNDVYGYDGIGTNGKVLERFTTEVNPKGMLSVDLNTPYPAALRTSSATASPASTSPASTTSAG